MAQGVLPYKYEEERSDGGMTAMAGLPIYLDLAWVLGLGDYIRAHVQVRKSDQGWTDEQAVLSLILLNLAGGDCVDDIKILEKDEGFCKILGRVETKGLKRQQRRAMERRWRKERHRSVPSPSALFRYLKSFHDPEQEKKRQPGKAFIPTPNEHLRGLRETNREVVVSIQQRHPETEATLDTDATLVETQKKEALFSYQGYKAYQPFNVWWAEQGLVLHSEFRDGNVPAGYEQLRVFQEALEMLPEGVIKVYLRSDTAGYEHNLLRYCETGQNKRFGKIGFAIGVDVTSEFKKAVAEVEESEWNPLWKEIQGEKIRTNTEWAEVCFVPNAISRSKGDPVYRYLATRELLEQPELPGMENHRELPFPTLSMQKKRYKIFGIVTNRDLEGSELINWLHKRCGKSEEAHSMMKEDLAGGKLPSSDFGENAAWWWIMILAFNLNSAMKRLVLEGSWVSKRMKAIRFSLIDLPGRVVKHARELIVRLVKGHPSIEVLVKARQRIMELGYLPSG
ncbi:MAG: IS1380 family transposase [Deltaproteobacteria bacterium]|nr:MAG: IS1380 family transposase [Deltaproteobacteria bacterium]